MLNRVTEETNHVLELHRPAEPVRKEPKIESGQVAMKEKEDILSTLDDPKKPRRTTDLLKGENLNKILYVHD